MGALCIWALAKHGEGDIARMNIAQFADLRRNPSAALALLRRRAAGAPHEVIGDEHPAILERLQQCYFPTLANKRCCAIHLDHGQSSAGGCDRVALSSVGLLANPQRSSSIWKVLRSTILGVPSSSPMMLFIGLSVKRTSRRISGVLSHGHVADIGECPLSGRNWGECVAKLLLRLRLNRDSVE